MAQSLRVLSILMILIVLNRENFSPSVMAAKSSDEKLQIDDCLKEDEIKNNKTYCSKLRNYPEEDHLEKLLQNKFSSFKDLFDNAIEPIPVQPLMSNDPDEEFFCKSRSVVIYPQSGQNNEYNWVYIINSDKYKQGIRIEECLDIYKPCGRHVGLTLPNNYQTSCEQQYIYRTLVAYNVNQDEVFKEAFRLPACCKCILRNKKK